MLGVDQEQMKTFAGEGPLSNDEYSLLTRLLYQMPRISAGQWTAWADSQLTPKLLVAAPHKYQTRVMRLSGALVGVKRKALPKSLADRLLQEDRLPAAENRLLPPELVRAWRFEQFYEVEVEVDGFDKGAVVFARQTPLAWLRKSTAKESLGQHLQCNAMFLRFSAGRPLFIADRIAWRPTEINAGLGVSADHVWLAAHGVDLGEFDFVLDRRPLGALESDIFYRLLEVAAGNQPPSIPGDALEQTPVFDVLTHPQQKRGRLVHFQGVVRRVTKISLGPGDREVRERYGIDHYYEIGAFVPLGNEIVRMGEGEDAPTFTNNFPVIFCTPSLPKGLHESDTLNVQVQLSGFFLKLYSYRSQYVSEHNPKERQLSPMLIGFQPRLVEIRSTANPYAAPAVGGAFLIALALIWLQIWRFSRGDARANRQAQANRLKSPDAESLDADLKQQFSPDSNESE